jgi:NADPH:quinone reductase
MRAIVVDEFGSPERLRVGEVAEPMPGPDEVLVTVHAAPVNYVDLLVIGGTYQFLPPLPFIPGKGPAGVVTALGREVTSLRVGDRVLAMAEQGGYAPSNACSTTLRSVTSPYMNSIFLGRFSRFPLDKSSSTRTL